MAPRSLNIHRKKRKEQNKTDIEKRHLEQSPSKPTRKKKRRNQKTQKTPLHHPHQGVTLTSSKTPRKRATVLGKPPEGAPSPPRPPVAPHKRAGLDHALHVRALCARVRGPQVADKVVAAVVHVARLGLCAAVDAAPEGEPPRVRDALVALELLAGGEGGRAEVAGELVVLGDLVGSGNFVLALFCLFEVCLGVCFLGFVCLCLCWGVGRFLRLGGRVCSEMALRNSNVVSSTRSRTNTR